MPTKTPGEILSDPDFQALPLGEQLKVMRTTDPNFNGLPLKEQGTVIATARQKSLEPKPGKGYGETIWEGIKSIPGSLADFAKGVDPTTGKAGGPIQSLMNMAEHHTQGAGEQLAKAGQEFKQGQVVSPIARAASTVVPFGPDAAKIGDKIGDGKVAEGLADATMLVGPSVVGPLVSKLPKGVRIDRSVKNLNNATEEAAISSVAPNVRMTPGQRAGDTRLQKVESNLRNYPGTSAQAEGYYAGQEADLAAEGNRRVQGQGQTPGSVPLDTNNFGAGQLVESTLKQRINDLKSYADKLYDSTRKTTANNKKFVATGQGVTEYTVPATPAQLSVGKGPTTIQAPFTSIDAVETPVALGPIRTQLQSVYADLARNLPEAKRANSPAFRALDELIQSDIQTMPAMDFDKFLGAVKSIARNGDSPLLTNQSQRIAKQVIRQGEKAFQDAIQGAGPNVLGKLQNARKAVKEYYGTAEFLDDMRSEPAALYKNLVTGGDQVQGTLLHLKQVAPKALDTVGRTFLNNLMEKATNEGGWGRSAGVKADWERMGPETKNLVFGPKTTQALDNFFLAAKRLAVNEGSPTAGRIAAFMSYGDVGTAIAELVTGVATGHPMMGAVGAAGTLYKTRVQPGMLAKVAFQPAGAQLLNRVMTIPTGSMEFAKSMGALNALAISGAQSGQKSK